MLGHKQDPGHVDVCRVGAREAVAGDRMRAPAT